VALVSTPVSFEKTSTMPLRFSKKLGRCVGWGCFSKKAGEEYDDEHGDHFPDDELFKAVGGLMKMDFKDREIDIEHVGAAQGSIVTAFHMGEDIAKSLGVDTGGNYGTLIDFEPSAELLAKIEGGKLLSLSMYGTAVAEPVAKSAAGVEVSAAKRKRVMRDVKLTKWAVCESPAHVGAGITLVKSLPSDELLEAVMKTRPASVSVQVAKRTPAATSIELGHQHAIYDADEKDGSTSYERAEGFQYGHSHQWLRGADGTITLLVADGHTHTLATETIAMSKPEDFAKATADLATAQGRCTTLSKALLLLAALPFEQQTFAKRYTDTAALEGFLAKSDADRAALAKPIHKSERTGRCYYAGEESLVELAKDNDAAHVELAKAKEAGEVARIEKSVREVIPFWKGKDETKVALMRAIEALPEELRKDALESMRAANVAFESVTKAVGHGPGGGGPSGSDPEARLFAAHAAFAKAAGKSMPQTASEFAATEEGQKLFAEAYPTGN
jgi:hypothetical protein